jgi:hypothetical protein
MPPVQRLDFIRATVRSIRPRGASMRPNERESNFAGQFCVCPVEKPNRFREGVSNRL